MYPLAAYIIRLSPFQPVYYLMNSFVHLPHTILIHAGCKIREKAKPRRSSRQEASKDSCEPCPENINGVTLSILYTVKSVLSSKQTTAPRLLDDVSRLPVVVSHSPSPSFLPPSKVSDKYLIFYVSKGREDFCFQLPFFFEEERNLKCDPSYPWVSSW